MPQRRKPVEQRLLEGTYKPSRHGPLPGDPATPAKPKRLKGAAAKVWTELLGLLAGRLQRSDGPMLAELCQWWARLNAINEKLDGAEAGSAEFGRCIVHAGIATDKVGKLAAAFGLTPADRAKLGFTSAAGNAPKTWATTLRSRPRPDLL